MENKSFLGKLKRGLFMTHTEVIEKVRDAMKADLGVDRAVLDALEEGLIGADVGAELTMELMDRLEQRIKDEKIRNVEELTSALREETRKLIPRKAMETIDLDQAHPFVILVVGVNGTGKTTTIAKLAQRWKGEGRSVVLERPIPSGRQPSNSSRAGPSGSTFRWFGIVPGPIRARWLTIRSPRRSPARVTWR